MTLQFARRGMPLELSQPVQAMFAEQGNVTGHGRLRHAGELSGLLLRLAVADQPQNFHPTLHEGHRVFKPFGG